MQRKDEHTDVIPVRKPDPVAPPDRAEAPPPAADEASPPPSAAGPEHEIADRVDLTGNLAVRVEPEHPCPHCGAEMIDHDAPEGTPKHNAWHCNACGGCFVHRGSAWFLREGHVAPAGWAGNT